MLCGAGLFTPAFPLSSKACNPALCTPCFFYVTQLRRLRGFNSLLPLSALLWLTPFALEVMLRGQVLHGFVLQTSKTEKSKQKLTPFQVPTFAIGDLMACLKPNHGYGKSFDCHQKRLF